MATAEDRIKWSEVLEPDTIEEDLSPYLPHITDYAQGTVIHNYLEKNYDLEGTEWEQEVDFNGETIRYDCHDGDFLYEFKTKSVLDTRYLPELDHIKQIKKYLEATDTDLGFIVYISREDFSVEEYPILKDI